MEVNAKSIANAIIQCYVDDIFFKLNFFFSPEHKENRSPNTFPKKGIFNYRSAVPFIAIKLKISRARIYNHIKESSYLETT